MNDYLNKKIELEKQQKREVQKPGISLAEKVQSFLQVDEEETLLDELASVKRQISEIKVGPKKVKSCVPCGRIIHRDLFKRHLASKNH